MRAALSHWPFNKATDLWHIGVAHAPIARFLEPIDRNPVAVTWLPLPRNFTFIADPFAIPDESGGLTIFAERLDYRVKQGQIHYYRLDADFKLIDSGLALAKKTHLSYPFLIEHKGTLYMLPEASRSGKLTLYAAQHFPEEWIPVTELLDLPAIDASVIFYQETWWMFFALPGDAGRAMNELHLAYADSLFGPWQLHAGNPVRIGFEASRMGGTPFTHEGVLYLPMQDCSKTYGGGMTILRVNELSPKAFAATICAQLKAQDFHPEFRDGMHTVSACGNVTLIDVKRTSYSPMRLLIDCKRRIRRLFGSKRVLP